jgi:hypothetical protein
MLAQALFLEKYMKPLLKDATKERVEMAWLDCWRLLLAAWKIVLHTMDCHAGLSGQYGYDGGRSGRPALLGLLA